MNNKITKIENLRENQYLDNLDLSYNQIEFIENLDHLNLKKLNLMNNCIRNITGLDNLTSLLELNLSKNYISRLKGLQYLTNLRYLYVSSNLLSRAKQVAYISELPYLTDVDFCFNDVQNRKFYRYQVYY
jgi:protein phosphatase 1 regulatory subunit 7